MYLPGAPLWPYAARPESPADPSARNLRPSAVLLGAGPLGPSGGPQSDWAGDHSQGATGTTAFGLGREKVVKARATNSDGGCSYPGTAVRGQSRSRARAHTARRSPSSGSSALSAQLSADTQWTQTMSAVR